MARLSTFDSNPHYLPDNSDDAVERAQAEANEYFRAATRPYKSEFDQRMGFIAPWAYSPRWERDRAAARAKYSLAVAPYLAMMDQVVADILATGEMSEATETAWNEIGYAKLRSALDECERLNVKWVWQLEHGATISLSAAPGHSVASAERGA